MALLGQLVVKVTGDATQFNQTMNKTQTSFKDVGKTIGKVALGIGVALVGIGVAAVKMASDAEETQNKYTAVFGSLGDVAEDTAKRLAESYGLSSRASKQLLSDTGDLLSGFGFTAEAALDISTQVNELAVDLASFTNYAGGAEGASAALTKALLGERESIKSLGIAIMEKDVQQRVAMLTSQGVTFETERQAKAYATLQLAQEQSKNAIGDYARSTGTFAQNLRIMSSRIEDAGASLGTILLPVANDLIKIFTNLVEEITKNKELFAALSTAIKAIGGVVKDLTPLIFKLLTAISPIISVVFKLVSEIVTALMPAIETIIDLVIEFLPIIKSLVQLFGSFVTVIAKIISVLVKLIAPLLKPLLRLIEAFMPVLEPVMKGFEKFGEILESDLVQGIIEAVSFLLKLLDPISQITGALEALGVIEKQNSDSTETAANSADEAAASFDKYTKSLDKNVEKQEEVNEERLKIEQEWKENLFDLKASETEKIEAEYQKQIEAARKAGASTADIEEYYSLKRRELAEAEWNAMFPEYAKNKEFVSGLLEGLSKTDLQREADTFKGRLDLLNGYIEERKKLIEIAGADIGIILESGAMSNEGDLAEQTKLLEDALIAREELEKQHSENVEAIYQQRASGYKKFIDLSLNLFGDMFSTLGEALVTGQNGWLAFAQAAVTAIATVVDALGNEAIAKAAVATANAIGAYASYNFPQGAMYTSEAVAWGAAGVAAKLGAGIIKGLASQIKLADGGYISPVPGGTTVTMAETPGIGEYAVPDRADIWQQIADKISSRQGVTNNITNNSLPGRLVLNIDGREFYATLSEASRDGRYLIDPNRGLARG